VSGSSPVRNRPDVSPSTNESFGFGLEQDNWRLDERQQQIPAPAGAQSIGQKGPDSQQTKMATCSLYSTHSSISPEKSRLSVSLSYIFLHRLELVWTGTFHESLK
jgi:hypothetical protein